MASISSTMLEVIDITKVGQYILRLKSINMNIAIPEIIKVSSTFNL
jgi:hypothetical protein